MTRFCNHCRKEFVPVVNHHRMCPTCADRVQGRPSICIERKEVFSDVVVLGFNIDWQEIRGVETDAPAYKWTLKGSEYGASWQGRFDFFASEPVTVGTVIRITEIITTHQAETRELKSDSDYYQNYETLKESGKTFYERRYFRIEKIQEKTEKTLVMIEAYSKVTLKGYGRQFRERIEVPCNVPHWIISGSSRNGRFGTDVVMAITSTETPIYHYHYEDGNEEVTAIPEEKLYA